MAILVRSEDTNLYTVVIPNKGKETVILLHGGPGVPENLAPVAEYLAKEFQVIYFHQRGTLNSPCSSGSYSMASYISDIDSIAVHFNLEKFHLFGHSWGGLYAQVYAAKRQDKLLSMFACSPATGTGWQWAKTVLEVSKFHKKKSTGPEWAAMVKNSALGMLGSYKAYGKFYTQFSINCNRDFRVENPVQVMVDHINASPITRTYFSLLLYPPLPKLPDPGFKITVVFGDDDIFGDSTSYVRERYPTCTFIVIPASGHFPWLHNEEAFLKVLADHYRVERPSSVTFKE
ncbi:alpha/beta fold hydrolase [Pontibacter pamirensis]|uniref:alpha/beta fold hydrolase n=1 Tax=Pontibacter pamirensis TaxID=2562824 RepID=UPI001389568B|nr:alpha/beta hydrolase [Pontibacter pamirensis]